MIRFLALGPPELRGSNSAELRGVLTQPRLLALLGYLAIDRPRGFRRRDSLVAMLWPELGHESARNALRQVVHRLRRALGESVVASRGADELAIAEGHLWCDVAAFDDAIDAGNVQEALALYRGDLLPGFFTADAPEFERWLDDERARLRRRAATAAWQLVERDERSGKAESALHWARWASALAPDDETASRRLIELQLRLGDRAGALRSHEVLSRRLAEDFEATPSPETQALIQSVHDAGVSVRPLEPGSAPLVSTAPIPHPPIGESVKPQRRWVSIVLATAALVSVAAVTLRVVDRPAVADAPRTLAVLPFAVRGSPNLQYLGEGMVDLLTAKLDGTGLRTIDPRGVVAAAARAHSNRSEPGDDAAVARELGARWMIGGEVLEIAGRLHLSATLYDVSRNARVIATARTAGETNELFQLVDDLAGRLLASVVPGRDSTLTSLAARTSHSLPALKAFLEGEQALRAGHDARAAVAFRDATTLDSTFALAQYRLAIVATWTSIADVPNANIPAAAAARHAQRLTPLGRDLLNAYRAYREFRSDSAEAMYVEIVRSHPDNVEAWLMLGETRFHFNPLVGRSPSEGRQPFERVLALDARNHHALIHLARLAALDGDRLALDSISHAHAERHHDTERSLELLAARAFLSDDSTLLAEVSHAIETAGDVELATVIQLAMNYTNNFSVARRLDTALRARIRLPYVTRMHRRYYADLPVAVGQWELALSSRPDLQSGDENWALQSAALVASDPMFGASREFVDEVRNRVARRPYRSMPMHLATQSIDVGPEVQRYLTGLLDLRRGDTSAARAQLTALDAVSHTTRMPVAINLARGLRADLLRTAGKLDEALAELAQFDFLEPSATRQMGGWGMRERFLHGEILLALGRHREALPWYESMFWSYTPWIAASHFRRGQIFEALGDPERARFHYRRFLAIWTDADPALRPLVARAEQGLERLNPRSIPSR